MEENELQRALPVGTILKSPKFDYRIEAVLGQGGFGITYKVSTTVMFDKVPIFTYFTIKEHFMKDACERDASGGVGYSKPLQSRVEESRGDFLAEARRLNEISGKNPNVVPVSEVFEANNTVYYVMEYLNGGTLRDLVKANGALSEQAALDIELPVAKAVAFLHSHHINHLDIKPENIMFRVDYHTGKRMPVLIDFGLAKHFDDKGKPTSTIRVQGCSDGFAPVEQYSGLQTFSPQADVYALGAVLYYMLVGRVPIIATEMQRDTVEKALPPTVSDAVRFAISRAMASPAPNEGGDDVRATRVIGEGGRRRGKFPTWLIVVLAVVVVGGIGAGVWSMIGGSKPSTSSDGDDTEVLARYEKKCIACDSLINNGDNAEYEPLLKAKTLLDDIRVVEKSDEAEQSGEVFDKSKGLQERLDVKLKAASRSWEQAGDAQLEIPDYTQAWQYYEIANKLAPSDTLRYKIDMCVGR